MNKLEYFKAAIKNDVHLRKAWMISAFSVIVEDSDAWVEDPYEYRIIQDMSGVYYLSNEGSEPTKVKIPDAQAGRPLFNVNDIIDLVPGDLLNVKKPITTTIGKVLVNDIILNKCLEGKLEYQEGEFKLSTVTEFVERHLVDGYSTDPDAKYGELDVPCDLWQRVPDAITYLEGFDKLFVPSWSSKWMTPPPGIVEYRTKLLKEHAHELDNPAVIDSIVKKLIEYDAEYLKGDDGAEGFGFSKKQRNEIRKKLFLLSGTELAFDGSGRIELIEKSLEEGWDPKDLPALINSLRMGSYNRGAATPLGGEIFKWLVRISSAIKLEKGDCGTKIGYPKEVKSHHVGFTIFDGDKQVKLTLENIEKYVGKTYDFRSTMYCKIPNGNYCTTCCGDRLSLHMDGVGLATSKLGDIILYIYMKKMHGAALDTADYDIYKSLS